MYSSQSLHASFSLYFRRKLTISAMMAASSRMINNTADTSTIMLLGNFFLVACASRLLSLLLTDALGISNPAAPVDPGSSSVGSVVPVANVPSAGHSPEEASKAFGEELLAPSCAEGCLPAVVAGDAPGESVTGDVTVMSPASEDVGRMVAVAGASVAVVAVGEPADTKVPVVVVLAPAAVVTGVTAVLEITGRPCIKRTSLSFRVSQTVPRTHVVCNYMSMPNCCHVVAAWLSENVICVHAQ